MRILKLKAPRRFKWLKVGYYEPARKRTLIWNVGRSRWVASDETKTFWFPNTLITTDDRNSRLSAWFQIDETFHDENRGKLTLLPLPLPHCGAGGVCMGDTETGVLPPYRFWYSSFRDPYPFPYPKWETLSKNPKNQEQILKLMHDKNAYNTNYNKEIYSLPLTVDFVYSRAFEKEKLEYFKTIQKKKILDKLNDPL